MDMGIMRCLYFAVLVLSTPFLLVQVEGLETCPYPDEINGAKIIDADQDIFQEQDIVRYECNPGYYFSGGSRTRTCHNGRWSQILISCKVNYCDFLDDPRNGRRLDSNQSPGQRTTFACNSGYNLVGRSQLICRTDGRWFPSNKPPVCEIVHCPEVPRFHNGRMSQHTTDGERNVYAVEIEYICDEGYVRKGPVRRRCEADGQWTGDPPVCDGIPPPAPHVNTEPLCEDLEDFWNGQIVYTDEVKGPFSSAFFICNDDSDLRPSNREEIVCRLSGKSAQWSDDQPTCLRKSRIAPRRNTILYQHIQGRWVRFLEETEFTHGQRIKIACEADHELKNRQGYVDRPDTISRNDNGTWTPAIPDCVKLRCDLSVHQHLVFTSGGQSVSGKVDHKTQVVGKCAARYEYKFPRELPIVTRTCNKGRIYMPKCIPRTCRINSQNSQHKVSYTDGMVDGRPIENIARVTSGVSVYARCPGSNHELYSNRGYITTFSSTCTHGDWSETEFPVCRAKRCSLTLSSNADYWLVENRPKRTITANRKLESGTEVHIQCKHGHDLIRVDVDGVGGGGGLGNNHGLQQRNMATFTCGKGAWSATYRCQPRRCEIPYIKNGGVNGASNGDTVANRNRVSVMCKRKHSLRLGEVEVPSFQAECQLGDWFPAEFPTCQPARCNLTIMAGSNYWTEPSAGEYLPLTRNTRIDSGTTVYINCTDGYDLIRVPEPFNHGNMTKSVRCLQGDWIRIFTCERQKCSGVRQDNVDVSRDGTILAPGDSVFVNYQVTVQCAAGFEPVDADQLREYSATCNPDRTWSPPFPECREKSCDLPSIEAGKLWARPNGEFTKFTSDVVSHGSAVFLNCTDRHQLFSIATKFDTGNEEGFFESLCQRGGWQPQFPSCIPKRCSVPVTDRMTLKRNGVTIGWKFVRHENEVTAKCKKGYHLPRGTGGILEEFTNRCDSGRWLKDFPTCEPNEVTTTTMKATETTAGPIAVTARLVDTTSTSKPSSTSTSTSSTSTSSTSTSSSNAPTTTTTLAADIDEDDCTIIDSDLYKFTDDDGDEYDVGTEVPAGEVVYVECKESSEIVLGNYDDYTDNIPLYNATCQRGELVGDYTAHCQPVTSEDSVSCSIDNGDVIRGHFDARYYTIQCHKRYQLIGGASSQRYNCMQGQLQKLNVTGGGRPICEPVGCVLPDILPPGMVVTQVDDTFLDGRMAVDHEGLVIITCPEGREPRARTFKCYLQGWIDAEDDWDFGSENTRFPTCVNATCECENGGICVRDRECRCMAGYAGALCGMALPSQPVLQYKRTIPVILNTPTNITCHVANGKPKPRITWKMDATPIRKNVYQKVMALNPNDKGVTHVGIVTITAQSSDAGRSLACGAWNEALHGEEPYWTRATLDVRYAPKVQMSHSHTGPAMREFDHVTFTCTGRASPAELVWKWYKDDQLIPGENSNSYEIRQLPREYHDSVISCEATNDVGSRKVEHTMSILYGPTFLRGTQRVTSSINGRAVLDCETDGNPPAKVTWVKKGSKSPLQMGTTYVIPVVCDRHYGVYKCTATVRGFSAISRDIYLTKNDVEYTISVATGDVRNIFQGKDMFGEGTDANVYMDIIGEEGSIDRLSLDRGNVVKRRNLFETGHTDNFIVDAVDVGNIRSMTIWHDGAQSNSNWYLESVTVQVKSRGQGYRFSFRKWLREGEGRSVSSQPTSSEVCEPFATVRTRKWQMFPDGDAWEDLERMCVRDVMSETCITTCESVPDFLCKSAYYNEYHRYCCIFPTAYKPSLYIKSHHKNYVYERSCRTI